MDKKIVLVGAGSSSFGPSMLSDLLLSNVLSGCTIVLHDIDKEKLEIIEQQEEASRIIEEDPDINLELFDKDEFEKLFNEEEEIIEEELPKLKNSEQNPETNDELEDIKDE